MAAKSLVTAFGCPLKYYVDRHSIFKYIEKRDTIWTRSDLKEEDAVVQWKEVLKDLGIEVIYALSPAAKGKVERPYRWLQDHLVRTCVREGITKIAQAREVLCWELNQYRFKRVHSTTEEIPALRFEKAVEEKRTLFKPWLVKPPFQSPEDIFCYRYRRKVDSYRRISFNNLSFNIHGGPLHEEGELRISCNLKTKMALIRFWYRGRLVGQQEVTTEDLRQVQF